MILTLTINHGKVKNLKHTEGGMMKRVKGTWLTDYVKVIRANKDKKTEFEPFLKPEDWKIVDSKILPSQWYPLESFKRLGKAIFKVVADSNLQTTRQFGRLIARELLKTYKNLVIPDDPAASILKLIQLHENFFRDIDSGTQLVEKKDRYIHIKLTLAATDMIDEMAEPFAWQLAGKMEELAILAGAKNVTLQVQKNPQNFDLKFSW